MGFGVACLYVLMTVWLCWFIPDFKIFFAICLVLSAVVACFLGYRAFFFSDDWYRAKEDERADWWYRHPRLRIVSTAFYWLSYSLVFAYFIWRGFFR
ncbi:MAG TPA: hypothetical protein VN887_02340 [Candidatus Angelobacter sp.]|nr:hypothetical protein [Candidatus Angelobacter sp.]